MKFSRDWWLYLAFFIGVGLGCYADWPFRAAPPPELPIEWPLDNPKKGNT